MRYFFSTGEASGEFNAILLAGALGRIDAKASFEGIGSDRMRHAGFTVWRDHKGWASIGPAAAIPRIVPLWLHGRATIAHLMQTQPDLVVLVDFGAFNVRLGIGLRERGYSKPILYYFPPGAWIDDETRARKVSHISAPLPAFEHQHEFYRGLGLPSAYFGHPLVSHYQQRSALPAAQAQGGTVAIMPGSRASELRHHLPRLTAAFRLLKERRPKARAVFGASDQRSSEAILRAARRDRVVDFTIERGTQAATQGADAAWVSSGTAVLECALLGVPAVTFYVVSKLIEGYAQRIRAGRFIALPNLVLQRRVVPELIQEEATPQALCAEMEKLLSDPSKQYAGLTELRTALGPADALEQCAAYAAGYAVS